MHCAKVMGDLKGAPAVICLGHLGCRPVGLKQEGLDHDEHNLQRIQVDAIVCVHSVWVKPAQTARTTLLLWSQVQFLRIDFRRLALPCTSLSQHTMLSACAKGVWYDSLECQVTATRTAFRDDQVNASRHV